jgi:hypothetical protein
LSFLRVILWTRDYKVFIQVDIMIVLELIGACLAVDVLRTLSNAITSTVNISFLLKV